MHETQRERELYASKARPIGRYPSKTTTAAMLLLFMFQNAIYNKSGKVFELLTFQAYLASSLRSFGTLQYTWAGTKQIHEDYFWLFFLLFSTSFVCVHGAVEREHTIHWHKTQMSFCECAHLVKMNKRQGDKHAERDNERIYKVFFNAWWQLQNEMEKNRECQSQSFNKIDKRREEEKPTTSG